MARKRKAACDAAATPPHRAADESAVDAVPFEVLREYRFTVPHSHAGKSYRVGDIIEISDAKADLIRRYAGADSLEPVKG